MRRRVCASSTTKKKADEKSIELLHFPCAFRGQTFRTVGGSTRSIFHCTTVRRCAHKAITNYVFRSDVAIEGDFQEWKILLKHFTKNANHRRAAGTNAFRIRMAYLTIIMEISDPENCMYDHHRAVSRARQ